MGKIKELKRIASIVGARPQFVKASVVSKEIRKCGLKEVLIHTGQHYDFNMSKVFFNELQIPDPDYNLEIGSGSHGEQTGKMLIEIEKVLINEKPDLVLVYGDTNTTLAGALAASKLHIPVAHIEAGLRSFNSEMPEETNRILTDHVSALLFAPTETAVSNLTKEGVTKGVYNIGDVMFDVALMVKERMRGREKEILEKFGLKSDGYVLVTIHRAENTDEKEKLEEIWNAIVDIARNSVDVVFPLHPRTRKCLGKYGLLEGSSSSKLRVTDPVSYSEMIVLEDNARVIITDSGGVQKESYFFGKPAIIPRNETEWVEILDAGWSILVGANREKLVNATLSKWKDTDKQSWINFFGHGDSAKRIASIIKSYLSSGR